MIISGLTQKGNFGVDTVRTHIHKVQIFFNLSRMDHTDTQDLEGPCEWLQQLHRYIQYTQCVCMCVHVCACVRTHAHTCTHTLKDHHSSPQINLPTFTPSVAKDAEHTTRKEAVNSCKTTRTTTAQCITTESHLNCSKYDAMHDVGVALHTPTQLPQWAFPQRQSGALPGWQGVEASPPSGRTQ